MTCSDSSIPKLDRIIANFGMLSSKINLFTHGELVDLMVSNKYVLNTLTRKEAEKLIAGVSVEFALAIAEISNRWKKLVSEYNDSVQRKSSTHSIEIPSLVAEEVSRLVLANKLTKDDVLNLASVNKKFNSAVKHVFYKEWNSTQRDDIRNVLFGKENIIKNMLEKRWIYSPIIAIEKYTDNDDILRALRYACHFGNITVVKFIVNDMNLDANVVLKENDVLNSAIFGGNLEIVKLLVDHYKYNTTDIRNNDKAIWQACYKGRLEILKYLIKHFNLTKDDVLGTNNKNLNIAFQGRHTELIKYITENLTIDDIRINNNATLREACTWGDVDIVKYLVEHFNLDIHDIQNSGYFYLSPLKIACINRYKNVITFFVARFNLDKNICKNI